MSNAKTPMAILACLMFSTASGAVDLEPWSENSPTIAICQIEIDYAAMWSTPSAHPLRDRIVDYIAKSSLLTRAITLKRGREGEVLYCLYTNDEVAKNRVYDDLVQMLPTASELAAETKTMPNSAALSVWKRGPVVNSRP